MKTRLIFSVLIAACVLAYGNTLLNEFTHDDGLYIINNPQVTAPTIANLFSPNATSKVFRPVTFATLALNWAFSGEQPASYHLLNLLLHAAVVCLLYVLLLEIFGRHPRGQMIAVAAALLFALHPIHTEAVASAVGRAELLAAGFVFAAWILHLRDKEWSALECFALALLSKESAVVFLPLVFLGDYATDQWKPRTRYAWIAGIAVLYTGLLWKIEGGRFGTATISLLDNPLASLSPGWRILNAFRIAWKYVGLHFYPAVLSCDYSFNAIHLYRDFIHTLPAVLAAAAVVAALLWASAKRKTGIVLAGGIYIAGFATTANILLPTGTIMGERLAYLPSAGICLLLALAWIQFAERQQYFAWGILIVILAALGVRTVVRNTDWRDNFTLFSAAERAVPGSAKVHSNLGVGYAAQNQMDLAAREFDTALQLDPEFTGAMSAYGKLEMQRKNYQKAGALFEKSLLMTSRDDPDYDARMVEFATILGLTNQLDGAMAYLNREIAESPGYAPAWSNRALIHMKRGENQLALSDAEKALALDPSDSHAQRALQILNTTNAVTAP
jgi:tetratricopeptide (TPR) repeat protein